MLDCVNKGSGLRDESIQSNEIKLGVFLLFEAITESAWDLNFQSLEPRVVNCAFDGKVCDLI